METIVIFVLLVAALGGLAVRFGSDTRSGVCSPEQKYAEFAFRWGNTVPNFVRARSRWLPRRGEGWLRIWRGNAWLTSAAQRRSKMVTRGR